MAYPVAALLLIHGHCPHCPAILAALGELVKQGRLARLEVINIEAQPERAEAVGARSVPWYQIGPFRFDGLRSPAELSAWVQRAADGEGISDYFDELLKDGGFANADALLREQPHYLPALIPLFSSLETPLQTRIGIGALLEERAGQPLLNALLPALLELSEHPDYQLRCDACHYLGLLSAPAATERLRACLDDPHPDVREIAAEALDDGLA